MNGFVVRGANKLDTCLRMLYAEKVEFQVKVFEDSKGKICYNVVPEADDEQMAKLEKMFDMLVK